MDLNQTQPLVSVGIPTYDNPEGLRRTLRDITAQTHKNIEIIVSDNCSPGAKTQEVVQSFMENDARIQYYRQDENKGPYFNFRFVLNKAFGEYFMWAADDDKWEKSFIDKCLEKMVGDTVLCFSEGMVTYPDGRMKFLPSKKATKGMNRVEAVRAILLDQRRNREFYGLIKTEIAKEYNFKNIYGEDHIFMDFLGLRGSFDKADPELFHTVFGNTRHRRKSDAQVLSAWGMSRSNLYFGYIHQMIETIKMTFKYSNNVKLTDKIKMTYWIFYKYIFVHHFNLKIRLGLKLFFKDLFLGKLWKQGGDNGA